MRTGPRTIWLCADDYGISPAVDGAIRELILRRRINATSVMVASPHFTADEAKALDLLNAGEKRAALGLHVTLTAPFRPLSEGFTPLRDGCFPPLREMARLAITRPSRWRSRWQRRCAPSWPPLGACPTSSTGISTSTCSRRCAMRC